MRVLHVITGLERGGAEMMLARLVERGTEVGWTSRVVSLANRGPLASRIEKAAVPVDALHLGRVPAAPLAAWKLRRIARLFDPDVVQGWMYHGNLGALVAGYAARQRTPVVWNVRQSMYGLHYEKWFTRHVIRVGGRLSRLPARIIYNSERSVEQHLALGYSAGDSIIIPNGFDLVEFAPDSAAATELRRNLDLPKDGLVVGHMARFHPMKGHQVFLEAAAALAARRPDVHFVLAGRGVREGTSEFFSRRHQPDHRDRFRFVGEMENGAAFLAGLDVFCLSSEWGDAFPNVVGEAMACGVPCVVTDVGDAARIVGGCGPVVAPGDPTALARALGDLLALDTVKRRALGVEARRRIEREYSIESVINGYAGVYGTVLSRSTVGDEA